MFPSEHAQFVKFAADSTKKHGAYAEETFLPFIAPEVKFLKRQEKKGAHNEILVSLLVTHGQPVATN